MKKALNYLKEHPETFWLTTILTLSTLLRLAFLHEPFDRDEGQYATIAQEILRGGLPYRDAIEIKPPGTFYLYALAISLFGATTEAVRIFTVLYSTMTVIAVYAVTRQIDEARAGLCAALLFGIFSTLPQLQGNCNSEVFLVLPLTAGVWFFLKAYETNNRSYLFRVGLCAAFAMLIKPVALPVVALEFLLIPLFRSGKGRLRASTLDLASFLLPIAVCTLATITFFFVRGGLEDFLYWTVEFPRRYKDSELRGPTLAVVLWYLRSLLILPVLLGVPSAVWLAGTRRTIAGILPLLLILAICVGIALPGKNHPHYFIMIIPFLAIPGGIALIRITTMRRLQAFLALLIICGSFGYTVWNNYPYFLVYSPEDVSVAKYRTTTFVDSVRVARYLREQTRPDDYIFQWGFEPELYFLTDRRCPNPFLVCFLPGWSKDPHMAITTMKQSLIDKKPAYIVIQPEWSDYGGIYEIHEYVEKNCTEEKKIGYAVIFRCATK